MSVVKKLIIVEDKIEYVISKLPLFKNPKIETYHKHFFKKGEEAEIDAFLKKIKEPYPLIWLTYPFEEKHSHDLKKVDVTNLTLIIAVNGNVTNFIEDRFENIYKNILLNIVENIIYFLNKSQNIKITNDYKIVKFPNYMKTDRNIDVWDAVKFTFNCNINDKCSNL